VTTLLAGAAGVSLPAERLEGVIAKRLAPRVWPSPGLMQKTSARSRGLRKAAASSVAANTAASSWTTSKAKPV
jgi:hypothetical protein